MGRLRIKQPIEIRRQRAELKRLCARVKSAQDLAMYLQQIESPAMRQVVYDRMKPFLRFKIDEVDTPHVA